MYRVSVLKIPASVSSSNSIGNTSLVQIQDWMFPIMFSSFTLLLLQAKNIVHPQPRQYLTAV